MLAEWRKAAKGGLGGMIDPQNHSDCKDMADHNRAWPGDLAPLLERWLHVKSRSDIKMEFQSPADVLSESGPIWAGGWKTWDSMRKFIDDGGLDVPFVTCP
ncbi:MAG TPA: hypothetical protein VGH38_18015 [Bryobacteraceae bacterium]